MIFIKNILNKYCFYKRLNNDLANEYIWSNVDNIINNNNNSKKAAVITPTIGKLSLITAIESVCQQSYSDTTHFIIVDGMEFREKVYTAISKCKFNKYELVVLPHNTGNGGMNGHRIYAAFPFLINSEYIFFLDEDNWFDPNHISSLIDAIEYNKLEWAYSMRKICTEQGEFIANDNCESLGDYRPYSRLPKLVDTNCYGFKRSTLVKSAHYWYHPLRADRYFFSHLKKASPRYKSTDKYTVNYRLTDGRPPTPHYFLQGNQFMLDKYNNQLPWARYNEGGA
ncbi:hypothetical protein GCM10027275_44580 [Rhabdobacter roseus]|uniref:Glycosyltransferase 2-like domain-containing protein n=1 Tax=Rhabdobacter roseus TaxID=1655419 RepID=A0A840TUA0_9BACT|nr:glycosyltransferase family A protein [Rhabdobacter roseus]MBB5286485.1 hypothetical protein [Rhabdobacter roseus]